MSMQATTDAFRRHHHHDKGLEQAFTAATESMGIAHTKVDDLRTQVEQAVKKATRNVNARGGRQAEGDAVDRVLQDNGIDPAKFHDAMKTQLDSGRQTSLKAGPMPPRDAQDEDDQPGPVLTAIHGLDTQA